MCGKATAENAEHAEFLTTELCDLCELRGCFPDRQRESNRRERGARRISSVYERTLRSLRTPRLLFSGLRRDVPERAEAIERAVGLRRHPFIDDSGLFEPVQCGIGPFEDGGGKRWRRPGRAIGQPGSGRRPILAADLDQPIVDQGAALIAAKAWMQ